MFNLLKYEWKKQLFSKVVIGGILLVLIAVYCLGTVFKNDDWQNFALIFMVVAGVFSAFYVGIESLIVLNRDLRTKESHMLFMVPHSAYTILGAKILAAVCQILLTAVLFAAAFFSCMTAYVAANVGLARFLEILQGLLRDWVDFELSWTQIFFILAQVIVGWLSTIAIGFLSIISVRTVLVKSRLATPIAIVMFLLLSWGTGKISSLILGNSENFDTDVLYLGIDIAVMAVISVVMLMLSGWMAEKKLSV